MKYFIWGLGEVGFSFLQKLKENQLFFQKDFYCIDFSEKARERFLHIGGMESHFFNEKITKNNVHSFLQKLDKGDFLLDFCIDIKNLDILRYCLKNDIHYLSTADSSWNPDPSWLSCHQHYLEYLEIRKQFSSKQNTCLIQFGMNPGMVSCFAIKCLEEIIKKDQSLYVKLHRSKLKKLFSQKNFGLLCKKLGVTDIQEVDNDDQEFDVIPEENCCYSTWNVWAFFYETISSPEIAFGDKSRYLKYKEIFDSDCSDLYLALYNSGFEYPEESFSPQGNFKGHISTHEEIFSIRKVFSYKKYRPTVHFVYSPCSLASESIKRFENYPPVKTHLLNKNELLKGGESVGIIFQGKRFSTRYFGNYLDSKENKETATILQVSASSFAAFTYMLRHPKEGFLFPEDTNHDEMLEIALPYLKKYINVECPKLEFGLGLSK